MELEQALKMAAREAAIHDGISLDSLGHNVTGHGHGALPDAGAKQDVRRGKWTEEEEMYALRLITEFKEGTLPLAEGTTLRTFLSKLLRCDPMRISKKFVGNNSIGKQVFRRKIGLGPGVDLMQARRELQELERKFHNKLHSMRNAEEGFGDARTVESEKLQVKSLSDFAVDEGPLMADLRPENINNDAVLKKWYNNYQSGHPNGGGPQQQQQQQQQQQHHGVGQMTGLQTGTNYNQFGYQSHTLHNHPTHQQQQQMNAPQPHPSHPSHMQGNHYTTGSNAMSGGVYRHHQPNDGQHGGASQYGNHNAYQGMNTAGGVYGGGHGGNTGKQVHTNNNAVSHQATSNAYQGGSGSELFTSMIMGPGSQHSTNNAGYGTMANSTYMGDNGNMGKRPSFSAGAIFDRVLSNADLLDDHNHFGSSLSSLFSNTMPPHHGKSDTATTGATAAAASAALDGGFVFPWGSPALNSLDLGGPGQADGNGANPFDHSFSFGNISSLDLPNVALKSNGSLLFPSMSSFPAFHDDGRYEPDPNDPFRGLSVLQSASNMALDAMAAQAQLQSPTHSNQTSSSNPDSATKHHDFSNLDVNIYANGGKGRGKHAKAMSNSRATKALSSSSLTSLAPVAAAAPPIAPSPTLPATISASEHTTAAGQHHKPKTASANLLYGMIMGEDGVSKVAVAAPASSSSSDTTVCSAKTDESAATSSGSKIDSDKCSVLAGSVSSNDTSANSADSSCTAATDEPHPDEKVSSDDHHVEVAVNDQGHHQVFQLPSNLDDSMDGGLTIDDDHHHHNHHVSSHPSSPVRADIAEAKAGAGLTIVTATSPTRSFSNLTAMDAAFQKPSTPTASIQNFMMLVDNGVVPPVPSTVLQQQLFGDANMSGLKRKGDSIDVKDEDGNHDPKHSKR